jgi:hypothetical protein
MLIAWHLEAAMTRTSDRSTVLGRETSIVAAIA